MVICPSLTQGEESDRNLQVVSHTKSLIENKRFCVKRNREQFTVVFSFFLSFIFRRNVFLLYFGARENHSNKKET